MKMRLGTKILLLVVISVLAASIPIYYVAVQQAGNFILRDKEAKVKNLVETAMGVVQLYYNLYRDGKLTESQAKAMVKAYLKGARYGKSGYFWINNLNYRMVFHPIKASLNGKNLSNIKDPTGKHFFVEFVNVCKTHGSGFVDYMWPKPGFEKPVPKISYVELFKPWGWIIGTGIYVNDVKAEQNALARSILTIVLIVIVILIGVGYLFGRIIAKNVSVITAAAGEAANGDLTSVSDISTSDELKEISNSFNTLLARSRDAMKLINASGGRIADVSNNLASLAEESNANLYELRSSADRIAKEVETVAANVEETNASVEEVASSAQSAAQAAQKISEKASEISEATKLGLKSVEDTFNMIEAVHR